MPTRGTSTRPSRSLFDVREQCLSGVAGIEVLAHLTDPAVPYEEHAAVLVVVRGSGARSGVHPPFEHDGVAFADEKRELERHGSGLESAPPTSVRKSSTISSRPFHGPAIGRSPCIDHVASSAKLSRMVSESPATSASR